MTTVNLYLSDLRLCNVMQHSISALFDEWGQGRSVVKGSLTNHTRVYTVRTAGDSGDAVFNYKEH